MKALYSLVIIALFIAISGNQGLAQEMPAERGQKQYYQHILRGDTVKADKVQKVMVDYKAAIKGVEGDQKLAIEEKRARFKVLIDDKNKKLKTILNAQEQELLIPGTERTKKED